MAATYYFAATGKVPPDAIDRITEDTLAKPSELGVNLGGATEAVLLKALSVQAPERWQNMGEFRAALQTAAMTEAEERKKAEQERLAREARAREAKERAECLEREKREKAERAAKKKAERERLAREKKEHAARERTERLEREKREKAERTARKKAEQEKARTDREAEKPTAPEEKKKNPLPLILAAAAVVALVIFGATRIAKNPSLAISNLPAQTQAAEPAPTPEPTTLEENGLTFAIYEDHAEITGADKSLTSVEIPAAVE